MFFLSNRPLLNTETDCICVEIIEKVKKKKPIFRPTLPPDCCEEDWVELMESALEEQPSKRPTFDDILSVVVELTGSE